MVSCEKCWNDAFTRHMCRQDKSQTEYYEEILEERKDNPCSPKEQAGQFCDEENQCDTRIKRRNKPE